jgi:hypothetical protein
MNSNQLESSKTISPSSLSSASSLSTSPSTSTLLSIPFKSYNIDSDDKISNITNCYIPKYTKNDFVSNEKLYVQDIELKRQLENDNKRLLNSHLSPNDSGDMDTFKIGLDEPIKNDKQANFYDYLINVPYINCNFIDKPIISKNAFNIESLVMNNSLRNNKTHNFIKDCDKNIKFNETPVSILDPVKLAYIMNKSMNNTDKNSTNISIMQNHQTSPILSLNSQIIDYVQTYQNSLTFNR